MKIVDVFPFNGEPIVELRLAYLFNMVDEFVIVEARHTHSGVRKDTLYVDAFKNVFEPYKDKITIMIIEEFPEMDGAWRKKYDDMYMKEGTHEAWFRERWQRRYPMPYIMNKYDDNDLVLICDVDEIPRREAIECVASSVEARTHPIYFEMKFFYYNFGWLKKTPWYHAFGICIAGLRGFEGDVNTLRTGYMRQYLVQGGGWHCSYFLSRAGIQRKLESFAHRECDRAEHKTDAHLDACLQEGRDISGRNADEDCVPYTLAPEDMGELAQGFQAALVATQQQRTI